MVRSAHVTTSILLLFCLVALLWMNAARGPAIVVNVQSSQTVSEMVKVIQKQRKRLDYLSNHPQVIYRCPPNLSRIKYPSKATDDLTEIIMDTSDGCGSAPVDAVVLVHTAVDHFRRRENFRMYYGNTTNTSPYRLKVVFLIGSVVNADLQIRLERENMQYGDTVVGSFLDTYQNLTLKAVMGFRWLATTCQDVKLVIKLDDDVFINVRKFFASYWQKLPAKKKTRALHCLVWHNAEVGRTGKWKVEEDLFANASYPFPYCAGFLAVITPDLIQSIYTSGKSIDFFWIDDVFIYGMVPAAIKGVTFYQVGRGRKVITSTYSEYKRCRDSKGFDKCPLWATLTNSEDDLSKELTALLTPQTTVKHKVSTTIKHKPVHR